MLLIYGLLFVMVRRFSYISVGHKMLLRQAKALREKLDHLSWDDKQLFVHILSCYAKRPSKKEGVPVPYKTIRRFLPKAVSLGLKPFLEISDFCIGRCRRFKIKDEHLNEHFDIANSLSPEEYDAEPKVIFETMRVVSRPPRS